MVGKPKASNCNKFKLPLFAIFRRAYRWNTLTGCLWIWGGFVAPVLAWFAVDQKMGFAMPMLISTTGWVVILITGVFLGPETRGKQLTDR